MKLICRAIACLVLLLPASWALERSDLSPTAQALLPVSSEVTVKLKNGSVLRGALVSQDDKQVVLKQTRGNIVSQNAYARADVVSVDGVDICEQLAKGIEGIRFDPAKEVSEEDYIKFIGLLDEFVRNCGSRPEVKSAQEKAKFLKSELDQLQRGLKKIAGQWLPPVAASVKTFDLYTEQLKKLEQQNYAASPRGQQAYDQIQQARRDVTRSLPELVTTRLPNLIQSKRFDEAVAEMNAFLTFWISRVIRAEAGQPDAEKIRQVFTGMDFNYLIRLQKQIMDAYRAEPAPADTMPALAGEEVYVPGGYFLMGNESAGINEDTFPLRVVWVSPFVMDKYEISNAQYRKFLDHVQKTADSSMEHPDAPPLKDHAPEGWKSDNLSGDDQPVVGVDWFDAYAYARWVGKRLPTEAEWEKAARGTDGRKFTWGNDPVLQKIENFAMGRDFVAAEVNRLRPPPPAPPKKDGVFAMNKPAETPPPPPFTLPVTTWNVDSRLPAGAPAEYFPDLTNAPSAYGAYHLAGNAAEWVQDFYDKSAYWTAQERDPSTATGATHVVRGGSYLTVGDALAAFLRRTPQNDAEKNGLTSDSKPVVGIRCVRDAGPTRQP